MNFREWLISEATATIRPELETIATAIAPLKVSNLQPAKPSDKNKFPFFWANPSTGRPPEIIRWMWSPVDGSMIVGHDTSHAVQHQGRSPMPFDSFLRGFYFPTENTVAIRPYFWMVDVYDEMDWKLSDRITAAFKSAIRPHIPSDTTFKQDVHNNMLKQTYSKLSTRW